MTEQRRHARVAVSQRVWCEGNNLSLYVQAMNMSAGGAFIQSTSSGHQDQFQLSFSYEEEPIVMQVEVVWASEQAPSGVGVRIVQIDTGADVYARFLETAQEAH